MPARCSPMSESPHTYVIGDVHGCYDTLMTLVKQLPEDARLIFVGDLIDRGSQSAEVVQFVREGGYECVLGNHEEMMVKAIAYVLDVCQTGGFLNPETLWMANGGIETLLSYGVVRIEEGRVEGAIPSKKIVKRIEADLTWMADLPLYLKLEEKHPSGKPVVITHAACTVSGITTTTRTLKRSSVSTPSGIETPRTTKVRLSISTAIHP